MNMRFIKICKNLKNTLYAPIIQAAKTDPSVLETK